MAFEAREPFKVRGGIQGQVGARQGLGDFRMVEFEAGFIKFLNIVFNRIVHRDRIPGGCDGEILRYRQGEFHIPAGEFIAKLLRGSRGLDLSSVFFCNGINRRSALRVESHGVAVPGIMQLQDQGSVRGHDAFQNVSGMARVKGEASKFIRFGADRLSLKAVERLFLQENVLRSFKGFTQMAYLVGYGNSPFRIEVDVTVASDLNLFNLVR